jgi:hypothetical protein
LARDQWHELKLEVKGANTKTYIDGNLALDYDWLEPISGKSACGRRPTARAISRILWSRPNL